ncbi:MAG: sorbosone dehydrogenase family protein [Halanaeroarchaeum sp.]
MDRRRFLGGLTGVIGTVAGCATPRPSRPTTTDRTPTDDGTTPPPSLPGTVGLDTIASGLRVPLDIAFASDVPVRYVAEQRGVVRVLANGELRSEPLLDLRDRVVTGYEMGLLGIALHPAFETNRRLFVRYSAPPRAGTPSGFSHTFVLAEFRVTGDGRAIRTGSERTVLTIPEPQSNHNAGSIVFGPEGYLYVGVGDGGAGGDEGRGHVDDWYDAVPGGNGQDVTDNLLGSVLRIDVDGSRGEKGYAIPDDNPLVGTSGRDEHFAWGFRNPWRLAFDGADLYAGDVGQNRFEEIDRVRKGGNYGWNVKEGTHCYGADACPDTTPERVRGGEPLLAPVVEYPHQGGAVSGISVITGNVYRGQALPGLRGRFVFGDLRAKGRLFVATPRSEGLWPVQTLPIAEDDAGKLARLFSFQRHGGEMYVLGSGDSGGVHRLQPAT